MPRGVQVQVLSRVPSEHRLFYFENIPLPPVLGLWLKAAVANQFMPRDNIRVKFALILEDRDVVYQTLKEYLAEVDPQVEPLRFKSFSEFASWFRYCFIHPPEEEENSSEPADSDDSQEEKQEPTPLRLQQPENRALLEGGSGGSVPC